MNNEVSLWDGIQEYCHVHSKAISREHPKLQSVDHFELQRLNRTMDAIEGRLATLEDAQKFWLKFKDNQNFNMFLGMYRLKGSKTSTNFASVQSKDVENIKFVYNWFKMLSKGKIGIFIYCFPRGKKRSMEFWQNAVKADQYYIYDNLKYNIGNKECLTYVHGSCRIQVNDTELKTKIDYWMRMYDKRCEDLTKNIH